MNGVPQPLYSFVPIRQTVSYDPRDAGTGEGGIRLPLAAADAGNRLCLILLLLLKNSIYQVRSTSRQRH